MSSTSFATRPYLSQVKLLSHYQKCYPQVQPSKKKQFEQKRFFSPISFFHFQYQQTDKRQTEVDQQVNKNSIRQKRQVEYHVMHLKGQPRNGKLASVKDSLEKHRDNYYRRSVDTIQKTKKRLVDAKEDQRRHNLNNQLSDQVETKGKILFK